MRLPGQSRASRRTSSSATCASTSSIRPPGPRRTRPPRVRTSCSAYVPTARRSTVRLIEREARIPDEFVKGLAELGAFGMKIPEEYGGLGLSHGRTTAAALMLVGSAHPRIGALLSAHQSIGVPQPLKLFGTEEQKQRVPAPLRARGHQRVPADRAGRGLRPGPAVDDRHPDRGRLLRPQRREAVDHERRRRRPARRDGAGARSPKATGAASPRSSSRRTRPASRSRTATPSWACAASRTA